MIGCDRTIASFDERNRKPTEIAVIFLSWILKLEFIFNLYSIVDDYRKNGSLVEENNHVDIGKG